MVWICAIVLADFVIGYNVSYAISELSFQSFLIGNIISGFILVATFGIMELYKSSYFSGFPYLNKRASTSLSYMKKTFCFWIVGKLISISVCFFIIVRSKVENEDLGVFMQGKTLMGFMLYFIYGFELFLTEIIPGSLVLKNQYLQIFEGTSSTLTASDLLDSTGMTPESNLLIDSESSKGGSTKPVDLSKQKRRKSIKVMKFGQLNIPDLPEFSKSHGFGPVFIGDFEGQKIRVRQLKINEVSTFQLREIPAEIKKWKKITSPSIEGYLGEYHQTDQYYYILSEANDDMKALSTLLESAKKPLTTAQKVFICKNVIKSMLQLGLSGDDFSHGHLCPNNILVRASYQVDPGFNRLVIQDFGFTSLKAYVSMLSDYSNKDQYTSPEQLTQKGRVVKKPTHKADIYSVAMLFL